MSKRHLAASALVLMLLFAFGAGCEKTTTPATPSPEIKVKELTLAATVLPVQNMALAVTEGVAGVTVYPIVPAAAGCPHSFSLSPNDYRKVEQADAVIAVGLGYEGFLPRLAENYGDKKPIWHLGEGVQTISMTGEKQHEHAKKHEHGHHADVNGHPFVSPWGAAKMTEDLGEKLAALDPANAEAFRKNAAFTASRLREIGKKLTDKTADMTKKDVIAITPVFDYLLRDAGLTRRAVLRTGHQTSIPAGHLAELIAALKKDPPALILNESQFDPAVMNPVTDAVDAPFVTLNAGLSGEAGTDGLEDHFVAMGEAILGALSESKP